MAFVDGFLALCSAVGTGTCVEMAGPGYSRQPISFSTPKSGLSVSTKPFNFGFANVTGPIAGRAIYDAPTGGNLLLVLPHATSRPIPGGGPVDAGADNFISLIFTALQSLADGAVYSGSIAAGAVAGSCYDQADVLGSSSTVLGGNLVPAAINTSPLSAGVQLALNRGLLTAHGVFVQ